MSSSCLVLVSYAHTHNHRLCSRDDQSLFSSCHEQTCRSSRCFTNTTVACAPAQFSRSRFWSRVDVSRASGWSIVARSVRLALEILPLQVCSPRRSDWNSCVVHLNFDPLIVNIESDKKKKEPQTRIYDLNTLKFLLEWMRNCENPSDSQCFQQS